MQESIVDDMSLSPQPLTAIESEDQAISAGDNSQFSDWEEYKRERKEI
jgi:hypothetical protein